MILTCNSCGKKFVVPDNAITSSGRTVQCGSCGNKWRQFPVNKIKKKQPVSSVKKIFSKPTQAHQKIQNPKKNIKKSARKPREMVRGISTWIASDFDPASIEFWRRELHYVGGNHSVKRMDPNRHFFNRIDIDERWKKRISEEDSTRIIESIEINSLLERAKQTSQI